MDITLVAVNSKYIHSNPAVRSIKYYLEARGFSADIKEFNGKEEIHRAAAKILRSDAEIIGFSCYIWNIEYVIKLAQTVKKSDSGRRIVFGGPEAYCNAERLLNENPFIDAVIVGEGEKAVFDMLKSAIADRIIFGVQTDLSEIGFVYSDEDLKDKNRIFYYENSRGCPFNCAYCLSCIDKGVRYKPIEQVEGELKRFTDAGVKLVKFVDRTFNSDMARAKKILEIIRNLGGETEFHIEVNPDGLDDEFIYLMSLIGKGKIRVEAGLQSINPDTLKEVNRPCNLERVKRNM
ncbi:MAG: cobalamin-dependent protein, partial [Monoglobales bacterium]